MEMLSGAIVAAITQAAPQARLRFVPKRDRDPYGLREGQIDLDIGKRATAGPELRTQFLFRDRYVAIVRDRHPLLAGGAVTARRLAACHYIVASQVGDLDDPLDGALDELDLRRAVRVWVPGFPDAMRAAAGSDLIALVPRSSLGNPFVQDQAAVLRVQGFALPVRIPDFAIVAMWHPRLDADPAQRWFRHQVIAVCRLAYPHRKV